MINGKNLFKKLNIVLFCLCSSQVFAQDDDFDVPPPPPQNAPPGIGGGNSFGETSVRNGRGADKSAGKGLSKTQREKFSQASIEEINSKNFPETIESFDFPNADINDIVKTISELTGKNFILDQNVKGHITIIAPSRITVAEAYKAFLSALAINGFTVVPSGGFLKIKSTKIALKDNIEIYSGNYYPNDDQAITRILHLKHISAEVVQKDLRNVLTRDGDLTIYGPTNSLIISDLGSSVDRMMKIIAQLDVPGFEDQMEVIHVRFAKSKDLADLIDKIVNKGQKSSNSPQGGFTAGVPRFGSSNNSRSGSSGGGAYFTALPDDRTNSIIVVGNKAGIERVKKLIGQLDFKVRAEDNGGVFVYYVRYGEADKIAAVLQSVTKDAAGKPGGAAPPTNAPGSPFINPTAAGIASSTSDIFGNDIKITADKATNSLVIVASKPDYEQVMTILSKIDIPRDQVYVEAVILELTAKDTNNFGIGYYQFGPTGFGKTGFNGGLDIKDLISPTGTTNGAVLGFASSNTVNVALEAGKPPVAVPSLLGFLQLLKQVAKTNILSTPSLVAMDNQEAEIEVGSKVATSVATSKDAQGNSTFTPTFDDATIKLTIKPFISPKSESVRMDVTQVVKQVENNSGASKNINDNSQQLGQRRIKTNILVRSGDTAVLGGLMQDSETETITKVPLLGDIPLIGWLFKSKQSSKEKKNLVVFLTPKIIRNTEDQKSVLAERLQDRVDFIKDQGGKDANGKKLEKYYRKAEKNTNNDLELN